MIHMLSAFNLKPGEDFEAFKLAYADFVDDAIKAGIVAHAEPIGQRVSDTPMDTDDDRTHQYFSIMSFKDRAQLDASYDYIERHAMPTTKTHVQMYKRIRDSVFTCWEDAG